MKLVIKQERNTFIFSLIGRLDTNTSPQLESFIVERYAKEVGDIVVDMSECDFVSSAGLRVIVTMCKHAAVNGDQLIFRDVQPEVMDIFTVTGFDSILTIE